MVVGVCAYDNAKDLEIIRGPLKEIKDIGLETEKEKSQLP